MKTIITTLLFFVCTTTFGQAIDTIIGKSGKQYPLRWDIPGPTQHMVNTVATGSASQWVYYTLKDSIILLRTEIVKLRTDVTSSKSEITKLKNEITLLKAGSGIKDSITALRKEINKLKAETIEIEFQGFVRVDTTDGVQRLTIDPRLFDPPKYTTIERDKAFILKVLNEGDVIYNTTTGVLQVRNKTGWKNL